MTDISFFKKLGMTDSLFYHILKAIIDSEEHYRNYEKCRRLAALCPRKASKKLYLRSSLVHKTLALITYDRAMAIRSNEFTKSDSNP